MSSQVGCNPNAGDIAHLRQVVQTLGAGVQIVVLKLLSSRMTAGSVVNPVEARNVRGFNRRRDCGGRGKSANYERRQQHQSSSRSGTFSSTSVAISDGF